MSRKTEDGGRRSEVRGRKTAVKTTAKTTAKTAAKPASKRGAKGTKKAPAKRTKRPAKRGRPVQFSRVLADRILDALAGGQSLTQVCCDESLPCRQTVAGWARRGALGEDPDLQAFAFGFVLACNVRVALLEDDFVELVQRVRRASHADLLAGDAIRFKLEMDALKWYLGKFRQRRPVVDGFEEAVRRIDEAQADEMDVQSRPGFLMRVHEPEKPAEDADA